MNYVERAVRRICEAGVAPGGACLVAVMLLIFVGVIVRLFGDVVPGVYELTELLIVVTVGFALAYTAYKQAHVVVKLLLERMPSRVRAGFESFAFALSAGIWGAITWVSVDFMTERWIGERTELLNVPYLPFRFIWVCSLALFSLMFLVLSLRAFLRIRGK